MIEESNASTSQLDEDCYIGRAALVMISLEALAELLQLPQGCHIDAVETPVSRPGMLYLRVRDAGWPTKAGWMPNIAHGTVTRLYDGDGIVARLVIEWGLPCDN